MESYREVLIRPRALSGRLEAGFEGPFVRDPRIPQGGEEDVDSLEERKRGKRKLFSAASLCLRSVPALGQNP